MKIKRVLPKNYILGENEESESEINSLSDLLNLQWMKDILSSKKEISYHLSKSSMNHNPDYLTLLIKENNEIKYDVIAYIYGDGTQIGLTYFK
jgi:hypothetical protein